MPDSRVVYLLAALGIFAVVYIVVWFKIGKAQSDEDHGPPTPTHLSPLML